MEGKAVTLELRPALKTGCRVKPAGVRVLCLPPRQRYNMKILKLFNPLIFLWNLFKYFAWLETGRYSTLAERYDETNDTEYF